MTDAGIAGGGSLKELDAQNTPLSFPASCNGSSRGGKLSTDCQVAGSDSSGLPATGDGIGSSPNTSGGLALADGISGTPTARCEDLPTDDGTESAAGLEVIADSEPDSRRPSELGSVAAEARYSLEVGMELMRSANASKEPLVAVPGEGAGRREEALPPLLDDHDAAPVPPPTAGDGPAGPGSLPRRLPPLLLNESRDRNVPSPPPRPPEGAPAVPARPPEGQPLHGGAASDKPATPDGVPPMLQPARLIMIPPMPESLRCTAAGGASDDVHPMSPGSPGDRGGSPPAVRLHLFAPEPADTTKSAVAAAAAVTAAAAEAADCTNQASQGLHRRPRPSPVKSRSFEGAKSPSACGMTSPSAVAAAHSVVERYSMLIARWPAKVLCAYLSVVLIVLVVGGIIRFPSFVIDDDFTSFIRADGEAMRNREAFSDSLNLREAPARRLDSSDGGTKTVPSRLPWRLESEGKLRVVRRRDAAGNESAPERRLLTRIYYVKDMTIFYTDGADDEIEDRLVALPAWKELCELCDGKMRDYCMVGESMRAWTHPTETTEDDTSNSDGVDSLFRLDFDRKGDAMATAISMAYMEQTTAEFRPGSSQMVAMTDFRRYFPKNYVPPSPYGPGAFTGAKAGYGAHKTRYSWNILLGDDSMPMDVLDAAVDEASNKFGEAMKATIYPFFRDEAKLAKLNEKPPFYYDGMGMLSHELKQVLFGDLMYAIGSMSFVTVYMRLHTQSFIITASALALILFSVPMAFIFAPMAKVNVASFLSVFLLFGIGCDVIFVFTDFWDQSRFKSREHERVCWTIVHAGQSCLATSVTTAASFFANLGSALQTLREFGLFMGLCVMNCFFLTLLILPPILLLLDRCNDSLDVFTPRKKVAALGFVDVSAGQSATIGSSPRARKGTNSVFMRSLSPMTRGRVASVDRDGLIFSRRQMLKLAELIARHPAAVLVLTCTAVLVFMIGVLATLEMQTEAPEIFPEDHNQVKAVEWAGEFSDTDAPSRTDRRFYASMSTGTCAPWDAGNGCDLHWCDVATSTVVLDSATPGFEEDADATVDELSVAQCFLGQDAYTPDQSECGSTQVKMRLITPEAPSRNDQTWKVEWYELLRTSLGTTNVYNMETPMSERRAVVMEDWATGSVLVNRFFNMDTATATSQSGQEECVLLAMCSVAPTPCAYPEGWTYTGDIHVLLESPQPRRLQSQEPTVRAASQINVQVMWGIRPALTTPIVGQLDELWTWDPTFEPQNPWGQRSLWAMCSHPWVVPGGHLDVTTTYCWLDSFRRYLKRSEKKFPSREFASDVVGWSYTEPLMPSDYLWMQDQQLKATFVEFKVDRSDTMPSKDAAEYKTLWDEYIIARNAEASVTANHAFHTSSKWVVTEAEEAIISSTLSTIIISASSAWFGVLVFSGDPALACMVTVLVLSIILGLAFFMTCMMGWQIGPIEVISLVIFVGYSIDFSLHIAHSFGEVNPSDPEMLQLEAIVRDREKRFRAATHGKEQDLEMLEGGGGIGIRGAGLGSPRGTSADGAGQEFLLHESDDVIRYRPTSLSAEISSSPYRLRVARVRCAMLRLGGATLSSAVSTVGSNIFLLFTTMNIFVKLGAVIITVTVISITAALVVLPAALMLCGPPHGPWFAHWLHRKILRLLGKKEKVDECYDNEAGEGWTFGLPDTLEQPMTEAVGTPIIDGPFETDRRLFEAVVDDPEHAPFESEAPASEVVSEHQDCEVHFKQKEGPLQDFGDGHYCDAHFENERPAFEVFIDSQECDAPFANVPRPEAAFDGEWREPPGAAPAGVPGPSAPPGGGPTAPGADAGGARHGPPGAGASTDEGRVDAGGDHSDDDGHAVALGPEDDSGAQIPEIDRLIRKYVDEIWAEYDKDNSGVLDKKETHQLMQRILSEVDASEGISEADFEAFFNEADKDGSGTVEKDEMVALFKKAFLANHGL